ncbi:MAG TPA: hypothetical protein VK850_09745 [Candidatus Binatia bacterium]|nr:hypothetical protein [Candidatus Binatia bacterium]
MRVLEAELLDVLPATDERARHSRRDLRKLNRIMAHRQHMFHMMRNAPFDRLVDLGSGDGQFALNVAQSLKRPCRLVFVDQQRVPGAPADLIVSDVMGFLRGMERQSGSALMANLFLHHFTDDGLRELFLEASQKVDWFFACEPRRSRLSLVAIGLLPLIGCNAVTRHDAAASIRAGFVGQELSSLWPQTDTWKLTERECGFASHCFMASR